jgi:hypothetical protein
MSYRQYNLMDQTQILQDVFEKLGYISLDFDKEMQLARYKPSGRRIYDRDYILPDYTKTHVGEIRIPLLLQRDIEKEEERKHKQQGDDEDDDDYDEEEDDDFEAPQDDEDDDDDAMDDFEDEDNIQSNPKKKGNKSTKRNNDNDGGEDDGEDDDEEEESMEEKRKRLLRERSEEERRRRQQEEEEQVLRVSVERFAVPEVLFRPSDAGLQSGLVGLAHAIVQSVEACPMPYRPALYRTIYLVGGVSRLKNLKDRLERELRMLVPSEYEMKITIAESPIDRAWFGAKALFEKETYTKWSVSRPEWEEASKRKAYTKLLIQNGGCYV